MNDTVVRAEFGQTKPKRKRKSGEIDAGTAFSELEPDICDLAQAAELAFEARVETSNEGLALYALFRFEKAAKDLKRKYYRLSSQIKPGSLPDIWLHPNDSPKR
jgi:hypothetical protein